MTKPMAGVRVVELSLFGFVPSAGAILADWGADVVKVEDVSAGDPVRRLTAWGVTSGDGGVEFLWEVFNRGKKSVGIDVRKDGGRDALLTLVDHADVFLTSFLPAARRKLGVDVDDIHRRNPRIVYALGSGHGTRGPEAEMGGFDGITYWSGSGASLSARPAGYDDPIPMPGPGFGDIQAGSQLAGAIAAALFHRERSGGGIVVDHSLLASGLWAMQPTIAGAHVAKRDELLHVDRRRPETPVGTWYRTSDGRWVFLGFMDADRYWPKFCQLIGRPDLLEDERFATEQARVANCGATVELLEGIFASRSLDEWRTILDAQEGPWALIRTAREVSDDPQAMANGYVQTVTYESGSTLKLVTAPGQFDGEAPGLTAAPRHGADTSEVLLAHGFTADDLATLVASTAITPVS
jgi:crotonobetainyl-CoA:carnitine CoA-transferase CaiB-like acyl-CoA transferase